MEKRQPIGIELVKKGVVKEADIEKALDYQKTHPNKKIGDILDILKLCDSDILINAMGEILDEKAIYMTSAVKVTPFSDLIINQSPYNSFIFSL